MSHMNDVYELKERFSTDWLETVEKILLPND